MAISKIILNGVTLMDVTNDTVAESNLVKGYQATGNDGEKVKGDLAYVIDTEGSASYVAATETIVFS